MKTKNFQELFEQERENHEKTRIKLAIRENEYHRIVGSVSYKTARFIASIKNLILGALRFVRARSLDRIIPQIRNQRYVKKLYEAETFTAGFIEPKTADLAVILHLFYPEMAREFKEKLKILSIPYDLYISVPDSKHDEENIDPVLELFPQARVVVVPNCGRDVLPFVEVMKALRSKDYKAVLKLHSKKSLHRSDGDMWRNEIVDSLIPSDVVSKKAFQAVASGAFVVVGPQSQYVSGVVNYMSTLGHMTRCITAVIGADAAHIFRRDPQEYGFFGGTMFWANYKNIMEIVDHVSISSFEPEQGQEDSTMAHALERLFSIIFEMKELPIGSLTTDGRLVKQPYQTARIPDWAKEELGIDT